MGLSLGDTAPDFEADTTAGKLRFHDWLGTSWRNNVVFLLWGSYAQQKGAFIDGKKHLVLSAPHPSPFSASRGFFGCRHFSLTNQYLQAQGLEPVDWRLPISVSSHQSLANS
jgi:hypothetical protein